MTGIIEFRVVGDVIGSMEGASPDRMLDIWLDNVGANLLVGNTDAATLFLVGHETAPGQKYIGTVSALRQAIESHPADRPIVALHAGKVLPLVQHEPEMAVEFNISFYSEQ